MSDDRGTALLQALAQLTPEIEACAAEAERQRKPVDAVMAAIEATDVYRFFVPRAFGGWELDLDRFVDIGVLLGEACASTGWVTCFCMEHNWMVAQFPRRAQEEIFGEKGYVIAPGVISPAGGARAEGGGFRLDGRWQWGTGVMHASWALVGAPVEGTRDLMMFAMPIEEVEVLDTWDSMGMAGTGSNDIVVRELFIPAHRALSLTKMSIARTPGGLEHGSPMYRMPMAPILALAAGTPAIGAAKGALRHFIERSRSRVMYGSAQVQAEHPAVHIRVGEVRTRIETAELLARQVAAETTRWGSIEEICDAQTRAELRVRMAYAVRLCRDAVRDLFEVSGASAQLSGSPLQRIYRDVSTIASHTVFDLDFIAEQYGRLTYGLEPSRPV